MSPYLFIFCFLVSALLVTRAANWLPLHYAEEEAAWLAAVKDRTPSDSHDFCYEPPTSFQLLHSFFAGLPRLNKLSFASVSGVIAVAVWVYLTQSSIATQLCWFAFEDCVR